MQIGMVTKTGNGPWCMTVPVMTPGCNYFTSTVEVPLPELISRWYDARIVQCRIAESQMETGIARYFREQEEASVR